MATCRNESRPGILDRCASLKPQLQGDAAIPGERPWFEADALALLLVLGFQPKRMQSLN